MVGLQNSIEEEDKSMIIRWKNFILIWVSKLFHHINLFFDVRKKNISISIYLLILAIGKDTDQSVRVCYQQFAEFMNFDEIYCLVRANCGSKHFFRPYRDWARLGWYKLSGVTIQPNSFCVGSSGCKALIAFAGVGIIRPSNLFMMILPSSNYKPIWK